MRILALTMALLAGCAGADSPVDTSGTTAPPVPLERSDAEVAFPGAAFDLEGVLTLPNRLEGERVPAVLLVHGSGPLSRDAPLPGQLNMGFGFEVRLFEDLADQLGDAGYAVLRYDKRSCFILNGCINEYPTPGSDIEVADFLADADAALDWLAAHPEIDPDRLVVAGHSQGASFVSHLLSDRPELAAGVLLAGGYRPIDGLLAFQLQSSEQLMLDLGYDQPTIDAVVADLRELVDGLAELRAGTSTATGLGGVPVGFWEGWMAIDDANPGLAADLDQALLVLGGDYDWNVPPEEALAWGDLLEPLGKGHQAEVLPCLSHAMNCISEPNWLLIGPSDIGAEVDPVVGERITAFLAENPQM